MRVIGLTGGIACGKSTVARLLREEHGVPVVDADEVAREVVRPGSPALAEIAEALGARFLGPDGALDRAALRAHIAHDPEARRRLEAITHPRIGAGVAERLAAEAARGAPAAVVEAALMVETGSWRHYQALLVVSCSPEVQLARLLARDAMAPDDARALIAAQLPLADKERVATRVIRNDGDLQALKREVARAWQAVSS